MKRFEMRVDPLTHEIYYNVFLSGRPLLQDPLLNKGHSFPLAERVELDLVGLMPDTIGTLEEQIDRNYGIYKSKATDLEKYVNLMALRDRNETVYFALLSRHIEEMLPIVYTPTVGLACLELSHIIRHFRGIYVTPKNVNSIEQILQNIGLPNISLIVATDGERILGYGDLGADGMGIPIGKIALYIAAAGIHPASTLPICVDVGTNNEKLLNDPLYIGVRKKRLSGEAYFDVIERMIQGVQRVFPKALIQWEDFGKDHAMTILNRYSERILSFNDDIQGTGAIAATALRTAVKIKGCPLSNERIVIYGFGQAGSGVANAIINLMQSEDGTPLSQGKRQIFAVDKNGLLIEGSTDDPYQKYFLQPKETIANWSIPKDRAPNLAEVIKYSRATILIGLSAQPGAFDNALLQELSSHTERPIVFALSNPTARCEASPETIYKATKGKALIATGSPFEPFVGPDGKKVFCSQCNNLYIFPGMGLGALVCQASKITNSMFSAASKAVSEMVTSQQKAEGQLLPSLDNIREVSFNVAMAVAKQARDEGLGMIVSDERLAELIRKAMWIPHYYPYRRARI